MRTATARMLVAGATLLVIAGLMLAAFGFGRSTAPATVAAPVPTVLESPRADRLPVVGVEPVRPTVPTVFTALDGLSDEPGMAIGYALDDTDVDRRALAALLADVFEVTGSTAIDADGTIRIGVGQRRTLTVEAGPLVAWSFTDDRMARPSLPPTEERARQAAQSLLAQFGVDPDEVDWQISTGGRVVTVTAWQLLNGVRTDLTWTVRMGPRLTLLGASGFAGTLQPTVSYPTVGAKTALERAQQPGFQAFGPSLVSAGDPLPASSPAPTMRGGRPVVIGAVDEVTIISADLGLAQHRQPDGSLLLVPAYLLTGANGSRWSIVAVAPAYLGLEQASPTPTPSAS